MGLHFNRIRDMRFFPWNSDPVMSLAPALWLSDTGSNAAQWDDVSGNGRHATQAVGANQPSIVTGAINGRQVRRFDGTDDFLETSAFSIPQPYTTYAVFQSSTTGSASIVVRGASGLIAAGGVNLIIQRAAASAVSGVNAGTLYAPFASDTAWQIFGTIADGTNSLATRNGTASATGNAGTNAIARVGVGITHDGTSYLAGDIAEIIIFPAALTATNRQRVERYLSSKYAITLA
jgi:hypothetical protein